VGLNPTRTAILDVFARMGASIQMLSLRSAQGEIIGDIAVKGAQLKGGVIEGAEIPLLIDELPMLAALGPFTEEGIEIRDAAELRVKESDRIRALAENLRRMGATVEERPDGLKVAGRSAGKLMARRLNRTAITASPWRLLLPRLEPRARRLFAMRSAPESPIQRSMKTSPVFRSEESEQTAAISEQ
jgi:hypothetical protein